MMITGGPGCLDLRPPASALEFCEVSVCGLTIVTILCWLVIWAGAAVVNPKYRRPEGYHRRNAQWRNQCLRRHLLLLLPHGDCYLRRCLCGACLCGSTAVQHYAWLRPGEMLDGLALAETTPGPLVLVLCFVGFMAGFRNPFGFDPLTAGLLGASSGGMGDLRTELSLHLCGCALHRTAAWSRRPVGGSCGHYRCDCRGHSQSVAMVRPACALRRCRAADPFEPPRQD